MQSYRNGASASERDGLFFVGLWQLGDTDGICGLVGGSGRDHHAAMARRRLNTERLA